MVENQQARIINQINEHLTSYIEQKNKTRWNISKQTKDNIKVHKIDGIRHPPNPQQIVIKFLKIHHLTKRAEKILPPDVLRPNAPIIKASKTKPLIKASNFRPAKHIKEPTLKNIFNLRTALEETKIPSHKILFGRTVLQWAHCA